MDDANRDGIPGIFIPFPTSGKLFIQSSCKASITGTLELFLRDPGSGPRLSWPRDQEPLRKKVFQCVLPPGS